MLETPLRRHIEDVLRFLMKRVLLLISSLEARTPDYAVHGSYVLFSPTSFVIQSL
jgi:hypothetical protein